MRIVLALLIGLMAGVAGATTYDNAESLRAKVQEYRKLKYMQTLAANDITAVNCRASTNIQQRGPATRNFVPDLVIKPTDTGWTQLLQTLNGVLNAQAAAAKAELEALGVTNVP